MASMFRSRATRITTLLSLLLCSVPVRGQVPADEIGPLPTELSPEKADALRPLLQGNPSVQTSAQRRYRRYFFQPLHHPLTPRDIALRESVRSLGKDAHRFVRCELKDGSVVTGAIASIGEERFFVRTGILAGGQTISYRELNAAPRPVAAVGEHLKNGLEWTGFIGLCVVLFPILFPLAMTGVIQD